MLTSLHDPEQVSYIYKGRGQKIDHIDADKELAAGAEHEVLMLNAEFPAKLEPGVEGPERHRASGDHNPGIARFFMPRRE